jgi:predicted HD superfamily hydrolase involved in NAD metabolism
MASRLVDRYQPYLQRALTPERLAHSLGVMRVMGDLAAIYHLDPVQALVAGLLHDAAKDLPPVRQVALAEEARLAFAYPCERLPVYLHAAVGAYLLSRDLGIGDPVVLEAVRAHSYAADGPGFDAPFSRCLRLADLLAPARPWTGMDKLRHTAYAGRVREAALLQAGWVIEYFDETGIPIHPYLARDFERLSAELDVDDTFFARIE